MGLRQEFLKSYVETLIRIFQGVCITYFESIISIFFFRLHHISRSNTIEINFYTDLTVTGLGFNLSWSTEEVETCDTLHTGTSGVLELHHMANGYKLPSNCTHSFIAPGRQFVNSFFLYKCIFTVNYKVLLNFTYFNFGEKTVASSTGYSINKHSAKG